MARRSLVLLLVLGACGTAKQTSADAGIRTEIRATRYCEILVGFIQGTQVHVDVYNTFGLNDCPADAWAMVNTDQVKSDFGADVVILNGPRYWMFDAFGMSSLIDPTPTTVGGIQMRKAGGIDAGLGEIQALQKPYVQHTINRNTTFDYWSGTTVYELVDAQGHVYTMQSYSVQKTPQTEASLAELGSMLTLPTGWTFRTRTLTAELDVRTMNGTATVVTDELDNTYMESQ